MVPDTMKIQKNLLHYKSITYNELTQKVIP